MFANGPLLTAQQGREGTFVKWLEDLGLRDFLHRYPLAQLVEWGWLVPQYRVTFPTEYFEAWRNFPECGSSGNAGFDAFSLLWNSSWRADDDNEPLWFLHPFFRTDDIAGRLLRGQVHPMQIPAAFVHANGQTIIPYVDYFLHWQGYALIDVIRFADCIEPILNTPDVEERAQGIVRIAESAKEWKPQDVLTTPKRWGGLVELMTWLSHYRTFREALFIPESELEKERSMRREGAKQLAAHLGISAEMLAQAIKEKLLVLAQEWRWANERHCVWTLRAYPYLQSDIFVAMEWLCYLSDKMLDYYLDKWQYDTRGQREWAELHKVLEYEFFTDRQYFLNHAPLYLETYNALLPEAEQLNGDYFKQLVDKLRINNYPFASFQGAYRQLHEELSTRVDHKGGLDFRELRPLDYYSLLAIRAEGCLHFAMGQDGSLASIKPKEQGLKKYIECLANRRGISDDALLCFKDKVKATQLHTMPRNPIGEIMTMSTGLSVKEHYLVQAFLCCELARNYFAHHHYLDDELMRTKESGFMLAGILATVLYLLGS
jgi:hypothetical protein